MTNEKTKIAQRIAAIVAKADSTDNAEEAASFMEKAAKLLDEHNITMLEVNTADDADDEVGTDMAAHYWYTSNSWHCTLLNAVCHYYGCRLIHERVASNKNHGHITGRLSARETVRVMHPFIVKQVKQQAKKLREWNGEPAKYQERYNRDIANALSGIIWREIRERGDTPTVSMSGLTRNQLVPVDLIDAEIERAHGAVRTSKASTIGSSRVARGLASNISLSRQVGARAGTIQIGKS